MHYYCTKRSEWETIFHLFFSTSQDVEPQDEWYTILHRERPVIFVQVSMLRVSLDRRWYTIPVGVHHPDG